MIINIGTIKSLEEMRKRRDSQDVEVALNNIKDACSSGENLFPLVIKAVKVECSLGEIVNSMKDSFGSYRAPSGF